MFRRSFLSLLSASPLLGWLTPKPETWHKLGFVQKPLDTLTFVAGERITLTPHPNRHEVTITISGEASSQNLFETVTIAGSPEPPHVS